MKEHQDSLLDDLLKLSYPTFQSPNSNHSTFIMGSMTIGLALPAPSLKHALAAISKAMAEESTGWKPPSFKEHLTSTTGKPMRIPFNNSPWWRRTGILKWFCGVVIGFIWLYLFRSQLRDLVERCKRMELKNSCFGSCLAHSYLPNWNVRLLHVQNSPPFSTLESQVAFRSLHHSWNVLLGHWSTNHAVLKLKASTRIGFIDHA